MTELVSRGTRRNSGIRLKGPEVQPRTSKTALVLLAALFVAAPLYYYRIDFGLPVNVTLTRVVLCVGVLYVVLVRQRSRFSGRPRSVVVLGAAFVLFSVFQAARCHFPEVPVWGTVGVMLEGGLMCWLVTALLARTENLVDTPDIVGLSLWIPALVGLYQFFGFLLTGTASKPLFADFVARHSRVLLDEELYGGIMVNTIDGRVVPRIASTMVDPNFLGMCLGFGIILLTSSTLVERRQPHRVALRWWRRASILLFVLVLVATYSRSAWLGTVVGLGYVIVYHVRRKVLSPMSIIGFAALAGATAVMAASYLGEDGGSLTWLQGVRQRAGYESYESGWSGRDLFFSGGWRAFSEYPFFGVGKGNLVAYTGHPTAHNFFLTRLGEDGLFGCVLSVLLLLYLWRAISDVMRCRSPSYVPTIEIGVQSCLLALITANFYYDHLLSLETNFAILGLAFAVGHLGRRRSVSSTGSVRPPCKALRRLAG